MKTRMLKAAAVILSVLMLSSCGRYSKGDKLVSKAIEYYNAADYASALSTLKEAENEELKTAKEEVLCYYAGESCFKLGKYAESVDYHKRAVHIKPTTFKSWVTMGVCYRKLGDDSEAFNMYMKALEYDPENADSVGLYVSLGSIYISRDKPYSAIEYLEKAEEIYPEQPAAHALLAVAYTMTYRYAEADNQLALAVAYGYDNIDGIKDRINEVRTMQANMPVLFEKNGE